MYAYYNHHIHSSRIRVIPIKLNKLMNSSKRWSIWIWINILILLATIGVHTHSHREKRINLSIPARIRTIDLFTGQQSLNEWSTLRLIYYLINIIHAFVHFRKSEHLLKICAISLWHIYVILNDRVDREMTCVYVHSDRLGPVDQLFNVSSWITSEVLPHHFLTSILYIRYSFG